MPYGSKYSADRKPVTTFTPVLHRPSYQRSPKGGRSTSMVRSRERDGTLVIPQIAATHPGAMLPNPPSGADPPPTAESISGFRVWMILPNGPRRGHGGVAPCRPRHRHRAGRPAAPG